MKENYGKILYRNREYKLVFNLNVMEEIQEEYGSVSAWGDKTDAKNGEPDAKAVRFGFRAMLNEGIDIDNEENGTNDPPLTLKQVGRILTEVGMDSAFEKMSQTVVESTKVDSKNE